VTASMNRDLDLDHRLLEWLVLRRVADGGVARVGAGYLDGGRPLPGFLPARIAELLEAGALTLAEPDPVAEATRRVRLTPAGQARHAELRHFYWAAGRSR